MHVHPAEHINKKVQNIFNLSTSFEDIIHVHTDYGEWNLEGKSQPNGNGIRVGHIILRHCYNREGLRVLNNILSEEVIAGKWAYSACGDCMHKEDCKAKAGKGLGRRHVFLIEGVKSY